MTPADVLRHSAGGTELVLERDEPIIRYGETDPAVFVLVEGGLEVRRDDTVLALITDPGSVVGELSLLLHSPASADVVAATDATVVRRLDDAEQLFRDVPEFGRYLAVTLAKRLHRVTTYLGDLTHQFAEQPGTLGLVPAVLTDLLGTDRPDLDPGSDRETDPPY